MTIYRQVPVSQIKNAFFRRFMIIIMFIPIVISNIFIAAYDMVRRIIRDFLHMCHRARVVW